MNPAPDLSHSGPGRSLWGRAAVRAGMCVPLLVIVSACGSSSSGGSPATGGSQPPASSSMSPAGTGGSISTTCPTAAQIQSATGYAIPVKANTTDSGTTECSYNNTSSGQSVTMTITQADGVTASTLEQVVNSMAQAQKATASPLAGYGDAAFSFTQSDSTSNADGMPSTVIGILAGSQYVIIDAPLPIAKVEAVARLVVH